MISKKEVWSYGLELTGLILVLAGIFLQSIISSWDKESYERGYMIQEEVNLAILSSLNDIATIQSTDDIKFKETLSKNVADTTNEAYSSAMAERERRAIENRDSQKTRFRTVEILLILAGVLFIMRGRWLGLHGIKERAKSAKE